MRVARDGPGGGPSTGGGEGLLAAGQFLGQRPAVLTRQQGHIEAGHLAPQLRTALQQGLRHLHLLSHDEAGI